MLLIEARLLVVVGRLVELEVRPAPTVAFAGMVWVISGRVGLATAVSFVFRNEASIVSLRWGSVVKKGRVALALRFVVTIGSVALAQKAARRKAMGKAR
jgi:hypothetical protein